MGILSVLKDTKNEKYAVYYSIILGCSIVLSLFMNFDVLQFPTIEGVMVYSEGFAALFMLCRHDKTEKNFFLNISKFKRQIF